MSYSAKHRAHFEDEFRRVQFEERPIALALRRIAPHDRGGSCAYAADTLRSLEDAVGGMRHHFAHLEYDRYEGAEAEGQPGPEDMRRRDRDMMQTAERVLSQLRSKFGTSCAKVK